MAEEKKEGLEDIQVTPDSEPAIKTSEEIQEEIKIQLKAELEAQYKSEIVGRDKKLTDLQKALKEKMTDEERIKLESEVKTKAALDKYARLAAKTIGLEDEFFGLISGATDEEIDSKLEIFSKLKMSLEKVHLATIKKLEDELKILKTNGEPPKAGLKTEPTSLQSAYDEAKKAGKFDMQTAIIREAARGGVQLNQ